MNDEEEYVELEFSPKGQYIVHVLLLKESFDSVKDKEY